MKATAELIARVQETHQRMTGLFRSADPERRRKMIETRRKLMEQLWELKCHASALECALQPALKKELEMRVTAVWREVAMVQSTRPLSAMDTDDPEHNAAALKTKATVDGFFRWTERAFRTPYPVDSPVALRKVS